MRCAAAAAAAAASAFVLLAGCAGGDGSEEPAADTVTTAGTGDELGSEWEPKDTPEATSGGLRLEDAQRILDDARFAEAELGLTVDEDYDRESGLHTPTAAYCSGEGDAVDEHRIARSQRWWANEAWDSGQPGGYTVGVEVVYYEPGGVTGTMAVFGAVPDVCPSVGYDSGSSVTYSPGEAPAGLPAGTVALRDEWVYPSGQDAPGMMVAIPVGDLIGFLYIRGDQPAVDEHGGELARLLAGNLEKADAEIQESQ
ncbi:hypothetical protein [Phytoactinopolyspora endophytica]|uniref:hypothetical protein n=1 Tax=Phytoactinopolyspora endophytica TaxID=1642495 RepID=UPI00101D0529|nr:hypothetical protein [Phytoactinopolyspora endophytica]